MGSAVQPIKTVTRCKLCAHPRRTEIDELLLKRSEGAVDEQGRRYNAERVKELLSEMGVQNPTDENIKVHWGKHCEKVSTELVAAQERKRIEVLEKIKDGETSDLLTPDQALDFVIAQGAEELQLRIENEGKAGITVDQMMKAIEVKTRRKADDGVNKLLNEVGRGIAGVFVKKLAAGQPEPPPLPAADVVEGEATLVE